MNFHRMVRRVATVCAIGAAAAALSPGVAEAAPPVPFPSVVQMGGCGQAFPFTLTFVTAQSGPEENPPISPGQLRFEARPALLPIPGASRLSVAWFNTNTFQGGVVGLDGPLPVLSKTVTTGPGTVLVTIVPPLDGGICQINGAAGVFIA